MKSLNKIWGISLLAILLTLTLPGKSIAQGYVSDQEFYDQLQPYGTWVSDPQYGNVWVPDAEEGFRPYATRGHWVMTDYGNTWVSDYQWGWAPFHYGRWRYDDYYGWEWIPGHTWAPAWVSWRHGGGYYGWAPLMPGISISISIGSSYHVPDNYWVCAPQAYINHPNIYNYYVPPARSVTIIHNTTIINNTYVRNNVTYVSGPRVEEVRQVTHNNNVRVYNVNNSGRPGAVNITNNTVNIYRPVIKKAPDARPTRVVDANAYKTQHPNERIANTNGGGFNRTNSAKLATVAKSNTPDNKVVHVNQPGNKPNEPNNTPAANKPNQPANTPQANQAQRQQQADQQKQQAQQKLQQKVKQTEQQQPQPVEQQKQQAQQAAQQKQQQAQKDAQQQKQQAQQQQAAQQAQQKQQQAQQRQQQKQQQAQQANQQRQQQAAQQKQHQAQQRQQQQSQQRQQQAQQKANQQRQQQVHKQQQPKPAPKPKPEDQN